MTRGMWLRSRCESRPISCESGGLFARESRERGDRRRQARRGEEATAGEEGGGGEKIGKGRPTRETESASHELHG